MKQIIERHFQGNYLAFYQKYQPQIVPAGGDEYKCVCPFPPHKDTKPSFQFNAQTGKFFCHGCSKKGHIFHFYAKLHGLHTKRDFRKILKGIADDFGIPWEDKKRKIVATYDYHDPNGNLLFQVCRMEPKDFRQRRPDGNGKWIWNLKGVEPVLYRLPDVLKSTEIIITEGEKDADVVATLGFCSTTCPMGAKKWKDHYNEVLKGKHVILIPDNDNEGREHMAQVGASLNGVAASLKLIELPDLPKKGDVSDWLIKFPDTHTAAERLAIMIDQAEPYEPPKQVSVEDAVLEAGTLVKIEMQEKRTILEPWLTEQSISLVSGWRGVGKTFFCMGLCDAITRGKSFGPWECKNPVPCIYVEAEMPFTDVRERIFGLNPGQNRITPLYIYSDAYASDLGLPRANLLSERWREKMKAILTARGIKLWVADNLASLTRGIDENSKRDWDPINQWLLELRFAGISTILPHHTNKAGGQRGTSAREDNIDISIILKSTFDYVPEDGAKFIVHFTKHRVRTNKLKDIADTQFQLTEDEKGRLVWSWGNVKAETKLEVLRLLDEGHNQSEVANIVGVHKGTVSKIRKQAIDEGQITPKNKLTQSGSRVIYGEEN
jgi:hypothetical protein